jgi:hypothetical protein
MAILEISIIAGMVGSLIGSVKLKDKAKKLRSRHTESEDERRENGRNQPR